MASAAPDPGPPPARSLLSGNMLLAAWLPTALFSILHYSTSVEVHWMHDILRRMYYLPIILAAFSCGLRGGMLLAVVVAVIYAPHAFTHLVHIDPAHTLEKVLEMVLYLVVGGVSGMLVDRERHRQGQLFQAAGMLREALDEQERTREQLIRTGRLAALGELVAGIAHEIKNPLHALRGTAEVIDQDIPEGSPRRRMWELHLEEIDRLKRVADRFLSFARPTRPESQSVELYQLIRRTAQLVGAQARQEKVEVVMEPPADPAVTVRADPQQLTQVLLNIAINAIQAMAGGGGRTLRFSLARRRLGGGDYAVVEVANDGPAIPEEDQERIFDPFVTAKADGVGLGLSVASRIMAQHDGFIRVASLDPQGVAFSIWVPASARCSRASEDQRP